MLVFFVFSILFAAVDCCELIREPLCQTGLSYNVTIFPNLAGHLFQGGAAVGLRNIRSLIEKKCSPNIREFLCRVYMPECRGNKPVLPSWEMCQEAYEGCNSLMSSIGYSWAFSLNCTKFEASTIDAIKKKAADKSAFWFGTGVTSLCNAAHPTLACEKNDRKGHIDSIVSRFSGNLDVSTVDRLLQIDYKFLKETVKACNHVFALPGGNFQVDPLSPQVHHPWEVRNVPTMTWSASPSQLFTLVMMNTMILSAQSPQAIYINIPGNNLLRSQTVLRYQTPMNPTEVENPYVFLLYEQNGHISSSQSLKNDPVRTIHASSQFKGLKAISWVKIKQDQYSISTLRRLGAVNNCPSLVSEAALLQKEPFLPQNLELEMSVDVTYTPSSMTFTSCCKKYIYHEMSFEVDPFTTTLVKTAHIRDSVIPSVTLTRREWAPNLTKFTGSDLYTLIMVDPKAGHGSHSHPYMHWMVLDIPHGNVNDGLTLHEYHGPKPPANTGIHTYYFLLYKQRDHLNATSISDYTTTCSRCTFDISKFVTDNHLELVGATWMKTANDEYIRHIHVDESSTDMTKECAGQPDYPQHCSSTTAKAQEVIGDGRLRGQSKGTSGGAYALPTFQWTLGVIFIPTLQGQSLLPAAPACTRSIPGSNLYTLIMVDPKAGHGSHSHPFMHWMVLDIPHGNVNDGLTLHEYHGPKLPANTGIHTYYFLLYKQRNHLNATSISDYTTTCSRCTFDISKFVTDNHLELVGATWMKTHNDEYIRHLHVDESSTDMTKECAGQPDYPQHCSSTTAKAQEVFG